MTLGPICHNSPSEQERLCGVGLLHIEASSGSITAVFVQIYDCCTLVHFHQNSFFINLGHSYSNTIDTAYKKQAAMTYSIM